MRQILYLLMISILLSTTACSDKAKHIDTSSNVKINEIPGNSNQKVATDKDYSEIDSHIFEETINGIFGGTDLDAVLNKLGDPIKKINKSDYERWYFNQGIEVDVVNQNDSFYMLFNYVYISPTSLIRIPRNIGIGSSRNEVVEAYKEEINIEKTDEKHVFVGSNAIIFIINKEKVESIFVATGSYTKDEGLE